MSEAVDGYPEEQQFLSITRLFDIDSNILPDDDPRRDVSFATTVGAPVITAEVGGMNSGVQHAERYQGNIDQLVRQYSGQIRSLNFFVQRAFSRSPDKEAATSFLEVFTNDARVLRWYDAAVLVSGEEQRDSFARLMTHTEHVLDRLDSDFNGRTFRLSEFLPRFHRKDQQDAVELLRFHRYVELIAGHRPDGSMGIELIRYIPDRGKKVDHVYRNIEPALATEMPTCHALRSLHTVGLGGPRTEATESIVLDALRQSSSTFVLEKASLAVSGVHDDAERAPIVEFFDELEATVLRLAGSYNFNLFPAADVYNAMEKYCQYTGVAYDKLYHDLISKYLTNHARIKRSKVQRSGSGGKEMDLIRLTPTSDERSSYVNPTDVNISDAPPTPRSALSTSEALLEPDMPPEVSLFERLVADKDSEFRAHAVRIHEVVQSMAEEVIRDGQLSLSLSRFTALVGARVAIDGQFEQIFSACLEPYRQEDNAEFLRFEPTAERSFTVPQVNLGSWSQQRSIFRRRP